MKFLNFNSIFEYISVNKLFCELCLSKETITYVGETTKVKQNSIDIDFYDTKFNLMDKAFVMFRDITKVTIFSDYANTFKNEIL